MKKHAILLVLALAFILRVDHITSPLIGEHHWRQADTASISRNYYENGFHFLYPQVNWGGNSSGVVECEFPVYSYAVALLYKFFGEHEYLGRLLSVLASLITISFLYLLVKKQINEKTALWSAFFYAVLPLNVFLGRTFQPEATLLMASVVAIYFFSEWIATGKWHLFIFSAFFLSLACLLKPQTLYLGLPLLFLAWDKYKNHTFLRWQLWLYMLLVVVAIFLWYYHIHKVRIVTFGIWEYSMDKWGNWDMVLSLYYWKRIFSVLLERYFAWIGFPIFLFGLFLKRKNPRERLFDFWLIAILVYFIIVARGNYEHDYYQLPIMLPACVFMGKVFSRYFMNDKIKDGKTALLALCLAGILFFSFDTLHKYFKAEDVKSSQMLHLAEVINKKVERNALIVIIADDGDPSLLYLSHHKGWVVIPKAVYNPFYEGKARLGAAYIAGYLYYKEFAENPEEQLRIKELVASKQLEPVFSDGESFIMKLLLSSLFVPQAASKMAAATHLAPTTGIKMVLVKGGCYQMGDTFGDGAADEKPVHTVCLDDFYMAQYDVTQGQWKAIMGNNPSAFKGCGDNCPVETVSWHEAQQFISKLNSASSGKKYRLPTEAEWEYSARSGGKNDKYAGGNDIDSVAWYGSNSDGETHPAGTKAPNGLGLYDMNGNVWQWVQDCYSPSYYRNSPQNNPQGPFFCAGRVLRGGSWYSAARDTRTATRLWYPPVARLSDGGFRLAMTK